MEKIVRLGTMSIDARAVSVFCKIVNDAGRLSITGVEGPKSNGDCVGACGQIERHLKPEEIAPAPGWTRERIADFLTTWREWHLNDMQAGSPAQTAWLKLHAAEFPGYPVSHYEWARDSLRAAGLNPDPNYLHKGKPYAYGHAWLRVEVPSEVLQFLSELPDTDIAPAWV